jgi:hypothetical protein
MSDDNVKFLWLPACSLTGSDKRQSEPAQHGYHRQQKLVHRNPSPWNFGFLSSHAAHLV